MRTAVDTNVISSLWSQESSASNAANRLAEAHAAGGLVICAPVYVELLAHPVATESFVKEFLGETGIVVDFNFGKDVWTQAGQSFATYARRRRSSAGGSPKRLLVDFIVGAHAWLNADRLMTLDPVRYSKDFPKLRII